MQDRRVGEDMNIDNYDMDEYNYKGTFTHNKETRVLTFKSTYTYVSV